MITWPVWSRVVTVWYTCRPRLSLCSTVSLPCTSCTSCHTAVRSRSRAQSGQPHRFVVALFAAPRNLQSGLFQFALHHEGLFVFWMEVCTSFLASTMRSLSKIPKETTTRNQAKIHRHQNAPKRTTQKQHEGRKKPVWVPPCMVHCGFVSVTPCGFGSHCWMISVTDLGDVS